MKSERGSALLTVILIVFVTAVIGSALSSFIMMNYKLRNLDNRISRAEYEAEKAMDNIYMLIQESANDTIINSRNNAVNEIRSYIQSELTRAEEALLAGSIEWNEGEYVYIQNGIIKSNDAAVEASEDEVYKNYCKLNMYNNIRSKINAESGVKLLSNSEDFGESGFQNEIKLKDKTDFETDIITVEVELYYKIESSPPIEFSVDVVIATPSLVNSKSGNYNLNDLINMTNWEMQDWGYL